MNRSLIAFVLLLTSCGPLFGQWTVDKSIKAGLSATPMPLNFGSTAPAGDVLFVAANTGSSPGTVTSITTNGTCTVGFVKQVGQTFAGGFDSEIWSAGPCSGSSTISVNFSGGGTFSGSAFAVSNISTATAFVTNSSAAGSGSGTSKAGPSITTTQTGDFVLQGFDPVSNVTGVNSGWTCVNCTTGVTGEAYMTNSSAVPGTYAPTWTLSVSGGWAATSAGFHATSTASGSQIGGFIIGPMRFDGRPGRVRARKIPWDRPRRFVEREKQTVKI